MRLLAPPGGTAVLTNQPCVIYRVQNTGLDHSIELTAARDAAATEDERRALDGLRASCCNCDPSSRGVAPAL